MASSDGSDILMQLRFDSGPLPAECQTEVDCDLDDYVGDYFNGTFFEVKSFSFGMNIDDKDPKKDNVNPARTGQQLPAGQHPSSSRIAPGDLAAQQKQQQREAKFARWKAATPAMLRTMKCYPVRMDEITIKRIYDKASAVLFKQCCNSGSFASASLVKRKDVGGQRLRGYLRMEFQDVLITSLDWSNGDVIEETFKFAFRKLNIKYRMTSFKKSATEAVLQDQPDVGWDYESELKHREAPLPS